MTNQTGIYTTGFNVKLLEQLSRKPLVFTPGVEKFWDDEHISKSMLKAHLDPLEDAASRVNTTIEATVNFIGNYTGLGPGMRLIDLGCGPGQYTKRFYRFTPDITGMDFSKRSIQYAKDDAQANGMAITYHYQNYLTLDEHEAFNVATLIYLDLCVLPFQDRDELIKRVHRSLKKGGMFIFDVPSQYEMNRQTKSSWEALDSGFFMATPHMLLTSNFYYDDVKTHMDQYVVIDEMGNSKVYRIYLSFYDLDEIITYIESFGFVVEDYYEDLTGKPYRGESTTIGIFARKV